MPDPFRSPTFLAGKFLQQVSSLRFQSTTQSNRDILRVKLEGPTLAKLLLLALHLRVALSEATACALFSVTIRNWMKMLLAVLLGNLAYFLLAPHLPNVFAHDMFQVDAGLLLDLGICAALYLVIRKLV